MAESTKIWSTTHRGIEVRFWQADDRWFAFAPGQESEIESHSSLRAALQFAFDYINDERRIRPRFAPASGSANVVEQTAPSRSSESKHSPNLQRAASADPDQPRALHAGAAD